MNFYVYLLRNVPSVTTAGKVIISRRILKVEIVLLDQSVWEQAEGRAEGGRSQPGPATGPGPDKIDTRKLGHAQ